MTRKIVLFELNEVPWCIIDDQVARRPDGALASMLRRSAQYETVAADKGHLSRGGPGRRSTGASRTSVHTRLSSRRSRRSTSR